MVCEVPLTSVWSTNELAMNLSSCQCVKYQSLIPNNSDMAKRRNHLLPDRHPQQDLFVCDIVDAAPKADMGSMEHPIFSLSTKPDLKVREYHHGENFIKITPSVKGLAIYKTGANPVISWG